jgi:Uma2 family endonuclease
MGQTPTGRTVGVEDYLNGELAGDIRHEFVNGEVLAMVGTGKAHNTIAGNLFAALHAHLRGSPCRPYMSDVKVRVRTNRDDRFYYPDLLVSCAPQGPNAYYTEAPVLIADVLSASTERQDRAEKFHHYRKLHSLQEYVLVAQDLMRVEIYRRTTGWDLELFGEGDRFLLNTVQNS